MKKVLLIRSKHDDFTNAAFSAADSVKNYAEAKGWTVLDKAGNGANKNDVLAVFDGTVDFVIHYGHGGKSALFGQKKHGHRKEMIFDSSNANVLKGVSTSTVSCLSAKTLGNLAINNANTNAYLGYEVEIAFPGSAAFLSHFVEAYNTPNMKLLEGLDFQTSYDTGKAILMQKYDYIGQNYPLSEDQFFARAMLLWAHNGLKLWGNGNVSVP